MTTLSSALLRMYPRAWRQRYGAEMRQLLAEQKLTVRTIADLLAGAIDARLNPQVPNAVQTSRPEGAEHMTRVFRCSPDGVSVQDQWRSAGWMIGGSVLLTAVAIVLQVTVGRSSLSEGLLYSAFPASLMLSSECTYLRRYSRAARAVLSVAGALLVVLVTWAAVAIANLI